MNDAINMLRRALETYRDEPNDSSYAAVIQALLICMKYNEKMWLVGHVKNDENGDELLVPGMMAGDDDKYYYILGLEESDVSEQAADMRHIQFSFNGLATRIAGDGAIGGICLNPWDGGCFVPREQIILLLERMAASIYE